MVIVTKMIKTDNKQNIKQDKMICPKCLGKYRSLANHIKCPGYPNHFTESKIVLSFRE